MDDFISQLKPCSRGHTGYWKLTSCHTKDVGPDIICADCIDPNIIYRCDHCNRRVCGVYCKLIEYRGINLCSRCVMPECAV